MIPLTDFNSWQERYIYKTVLERSRCHEEATYIDGLVSDGGRVVAGHQDREGRSRSPVDGGYVAFQCIRSDPNRSALQNAFVALDDRTDPRQRALTVIPW
jgi:hypothetical protein